MGEKIKTLIEKYEKVKNSDQLKSYTEEETKNGFIKPLFEVLGWDFSNKDEVSAEETISGQRVDYGFYIDGRIKFYLETKKLSADIHREDFANQAIKYSWNKGATWAVLTDFENLIVFNAQDIEKKLADKLFFEIHYSKYLESFDRLYLLSKEAIKDDLLDKEAEKYGKKFQKIPVTSLLYKDFQKCRDMLTHELGQMNEKVKPDLLDEGVQKLLDRLIFIRVAEDRGIEDKILIPLAREARSGNKKIYESMVEKFREFDNFYNSNLFQPHPFEQWEEYTRVTERVINILYGREGYYEYDFKAMPADVLGAVYESYLGHRLAKSKKGLTVAKDAEKRKEHGIYYTPSFIVDYIVKNALGPVLERCKTISDIKNIKVLDPACGSGSFLIKALDLIYEKYKDFGFRGKEDLLKIQILEENIYGVDLDPQAVEITRLNLLINILSKRERLPLLDNIKNGNSLISGTDEELKKYFGKNFRDKKPFNWEDQFPEVFKQGGFDVIIGNPPWGANIDEDTEFLAAKYPNSTKAHKDTYKIFIDLALEKLKPSGRIGFIVPNTFLYQPRYQDIKDLLDIYNYFVINLGEKIFSNVELPCCILISEKQKSNKHTTIDLTRTERRELPGAILAVTPENITKIATLSAKIIKKTTLVFDNIFLLKDAGIQYASVGLGKAGKGTSDLPKRIFQDHKDNIFSIPFYTGSNITRGGWFINKKISTWFRGDYKEVLKENEWVHFTKEVFESPKKIVWRQTADTIYAAIMDFTGYFGKTIHAALIKPEYKKKISYEYALAIFNSSYIDYIYRQKVLETGKVFPQVKLKYLRNLPFVIGDTEQQKKISSLAKNMIKLHQELNKTPKNSEKWNSIKTEIEKTDKKIDEEVYKLYGLTPEEIKIVEENI